MTDAPAQWKLELDAPLDLVPFLEAALEGLDDGETPPTFAHFEVDEALQIWRFAAYFLPAPDPALIAAQVRSAATALGMTTPEFTYEEVEQRDWVAESLRLLKPVAAGRFFVHGAHDADKVPAGAISLQIEAAQAFGSGNHATTQGCLIALSDLAPTLQPRTALDLGCGSGILALGIAKLWPETQIIASDIDPLAVEITRENAGVNGVAVHPPAAAAGAITPCLATGLAATEIEAAAPYDLIVANILMLPLIEMAPDIAAALAPTGRIVLSGLLETQQAAVTAAYGQQGLDLDRHIGRDGWATLILRRP